MTTYAIGDVQGCFDELMLLLEKIQFSNTDSLWFVGDLINRGPKSLETLRYIKALGTRAKVVLGNHDLHLLAVHYTQAKANKQDTLNKILSADDCDDLMHWLRQQPLAHYDKKLNAIMTHAGFPLNWSTDQVLSLANEVANTLKGPHFLAFLKNMYGNQPNQWSEKLTGVDRLRCITNYLTRMRFCEQDYRLNLSFKGDIGSQPADLFPWFSLKSQHTFPTILFGHWASLIGNTEQENIVALDTGCVWGQKLTAYCIETKQKISVPSLLNK